MMRKFLEYFGLKKSKQHVMSYKLKSSLYFASFVAAAITYYNVGQNDAQELAMKIEINKIENQTVATPNSSDMDIVQ